MSEGVAGALLGAAGLLLLLLAVHPFTTYPLSLQALARLRPRPVRPAGPVPRTAALCVCAYNEERVIRAKAENMLRLREACPGLELLVYVDAATDRTAELLAPYADRIGLVVSAERHGKTYGMNLLVARTSADIVVFSDANVTFALDAIPALLGPFADPQVGVVCGHLAYRTPPGAATTAATGSLYWRLEEHIKALETGTGSAMGADGSIFAVRRTMHRPPPVDLIDDMWVSLSVLCRGGRIVRTGAALAFEDAVSRPAEEFRRKVRIACQAFNVHRALWPHLRALPPLDFYKYVSHKLLRWMTAYLLVAGAAAVLGGLALAGMPILATALLGLAGVGSAALALARGGVLAALRDVLAAFAATGIGIAQSLRGERFQTWNPPESARQRAEPAAAAAGARG